MYRGDNRDDRDATSSVRRRPRYRSTRSSRNVRVRFREFRASLLAGGNVDEAIARAAAVDTTAEGGREGGGAGEERIVGEMNGAKRRGENV